MKCPICKKELEDMKYKPFCSKRCADIDLANWFNEKYSFEATEIDETDLEMLAQQQNEDGIKKED